MSPIDERQFLVPWLRVRPSRTRSRSTLAVIVVVLGAVAAACGLASSLQGAGEIRARRIVLVDDRGRERGGLTVTSEGNASLGLTDESGTLRASMIVTKDGPLIALSDPSGKGRVTLAVVDGPKLAFLDPAGRLVLDIQAHGTGPHIALRGQDGEPRMTMGVHEGRPGVFLNQKGENQREAYLAIADVGPAVGLKGDNGQSGARLAVNLDQPIIKLTNAEGVVIVKEP